MRWFFIAVIELPGEVLDEGELVGWRAVKSDELEFSNASVKIAFEERRDFRRLLRRITLIRKNVDV